MNRFAHRRMPLAFAVSVGFSPLSFAAGPTNVDARGVAIHGHDPVAYFVDGKPMKGTAERSVTVRGVTYWFANDRNLEAFKAEPTKYEPQGGGYCAYGVARGFKPDMPGTATRAVHSRCHQRGAGTREQGVLCKAAELPYRRSQPHRVAE